MTQLAYLKNLTRHIYNILRPFSVTFYHNKSWVHISRSQKLYFIYWIHILHPFSYKRVESSFANECNAFRLMGTTFPGTCLTLDMYMQLIHKILYMMLSTQKTTIVVLHRIVVGRPSFNSSSVAAAFIVFVGLQLLSPWKFSTLSCDLGQYDLSQGWFFNFNQQNILLTKHLL